MSQRFKDMKQRLTRLRHHLLPKNFSSTGDYTDRQLDRTRGYTLLVHAEIETFIEESAKEIVLHGIRNWKAGRNPSVIIIAFIASYNDGWYEDAERPFSRETKLEDVDNVIDAASKEYMSIVKNNHGIRDKNIRKILIPTGLNLSELDQTWLADLDSFGDKRGQIAHNSLATLHTINPQDELATVNSLLAGLKDLDSKLEALK